MNTKKTAILLMVVMAGYVLSYFSLKHLKPEGINTNDGPIQIYQMAYFPLRYLDSETPDFFKATSGTQRIDASVVWINPGNGYLYFTWEGKEYRAGMACDTESIKEGDKVAMGIEYDLMTYEDFTNHLIPYIINIQKV